MRLSLSISIVVALAAGTAFARAPYTRVPTQSTSAEMIAAEKAWSAATAEQDPKAAVAAWQAAALAFDKASAATSTGARDRKEAAYAAVLSWKNAMAVAPEPARVKARDAKAGAMDGKPQPTPLVPMEEAFLHSLEVYTAVAPTEDVPDLIFLRGRTFLAHDQLDEAVKAFAEIVTKYPESVVAEYSANLLLDGLNRDARYAELGEWAAKMRANAKLVAHPDLALTLRRIGNQALRRRAEVLEAAGRAGDPAAYLACGKLYREGFTADPKQERGDEVLFNAAVCFEGGGVLGDAAATYNELVAKFPASKLAATGRDRAKALRPRAKP
jgi:tetratricopeptide (TPR) repeat protein